MFHFWIVLKSVTLYILGAWMSTISFGLVFAKKIENKNDIILVLDQLSLPFSFHLLKPINNIPTEVTMSNKMNFKKNASKLPQVKSFIALFSFL